MKDDDIRKKLSSEQLKKVEEIGKALHQAEVTPEKDYSQEDSSSSSGERQKHIAVTEQGYLETPDKAKPQQKELEGAKKEHSTNSSSKVRQQGEKANKLENETKLKAAIAKMRTEDIRQGKDADLPVRPSIEKQRSQQKDSLDKSR